MSSKGYFLIFSLLAVLPLCSCRDNYSIRDSELIRRLRLRNTPQAVFADYAGAMKSGNLEQMLTLSTPRIREILENHVRFTDPTVSGEEIPPEYAASLRKRFESADFQITEGVSDENSALFYLNVPDGKEERRMEFRLVRDRHGNWKNDTRL